MNRKTLYSGVLLLTCGCTGMANTDRGAATGGVLGGILGLGVGAVTHHPLAGAAIGAGAGALAGGAIGNAEDHAEAKAAARAAAAHPPLSLEEVARMSREHISDALIINQIRSTNSFYSLNSDHVIWLRQMGVSEPVIAEMQSRVPQAYTAGPYYHREVVVVEPAPPVAVGIGFGGRWR
jgi:NAD(P)H-dependent flavin oxidoreductase YrpB (nitropropane dioxygenase family)